MFSSKIIEQGKNISKITTPFEERIEDISVNDRVGRKFESSKLELETTIEKKKDDIKTNYMENIESLDMKMSAIALKQILIF